MCTGTLARLFDIERQAGEGSGHSVAEAMAAAETCPMGALEHTAVCRPCCRLGCRCWHLCLCCHHRRRQLAFASFMAPALKTKESAPSLKFVIDLERVRVAVQGLEWKSQKPGNEAAYADAAMFRDFVAVVKVGNLPGFLAKIEASIACANCCCILLSPRAFVKRQNQFAPFACSQQSTQHPATNAVLASTGSKG